MGAPAREKLSRGWVMGQNVQSTLLSPVLTGSPQIWGLMRTHKPLLGEGSRGPKC